MSTFKENFLTRWHQSFGEGVIVEKPMKHGIYPADYHPGFTETAKVGIFRRVFNDIALSNEHRSPEHERPFPVVMTRLVGKMMGAFTEWFTFAAAIAEWVKLAGIDVATVPVVSPVACSSIVASAVAGALYGAFTKPDENMGKIEHIGKKMDAAASLPFYVVGKAVSTPVRILGYAAHAFDTAVKAYKDTQSETPADVTLRTPDQQIILPTVKQDFTP